MNLPNKKIILIFVILAIAVGGIYAVLKIRPGKFSTSQRATSATQTALQSTADRTGWKTYRNDTYGFAFQYPANLTVVEQTNEDFEVGIDAIGFAVSVREKTGLGIGGLNSVGTTYDKNLDLWIEGTYSGDVFSVIRCDTTPLGDQKIPTMADGGGDVMYPSSENAILTDRSYAIIVTQSRDSEDPNEETINNALSGAVGSFILVDGVQARQAQCALPNVPTLPLIISPTDQSVVYYSKPLSIQLASNLPQGVGAVVSLEHPSSSITLGTFLAGVNFTTHIANVLPTNTISEFQKNGATDLVLKFYRDEGGTKIYLGQAYDKRIKINFVNDAPYSFNAQILSDAHERWYVDSDGTIVLVNKDTSSVGNAIFFERIVDVTASNVYGCFIQSPWGLNTNSNLSNVGGHFAYGIDNKQADPISSYPKTFQQDFGCYAPDGTLLHKTFNYRLQ